MVETRKPTLIQNINGWLTPILVGIVVAVAGFIALEAVTLGKTVTTIGVIQKEVRANQTEMKTDVKEIRQTVNGVSDKLDLHMIMRDSNSRIHHRIINCSICHTK